jgi:hypothetical protein
METISPEFDTIDALLLYSIAYCQRHNYRATLGHILLECDAIYRVYPTARQFEDGFNRLIAGRYVEVRDEVFIATKIGVRFFNEITKPRNPKLTVVEEIRNLTARLNASRVRTVLKQLTITDAQVSEATQEAHEIFIEIRKEADEILRARRAKESS